VADSKAKGNQPEASEVAGILPSRLASTFDREQGTERAVGYARKGYESWRVVGRYPIDLNLAWAGRLRGSLRRQRGQRKRPSAVTLPHDERRMSP